MGQSHRLFAILAAALAALAMIFPAVAGGAGQSGVRATGVRLSLAGPATRMTAGLSRPIEYRIFVLADPYRVIVDMPEVNFQFAGNAGKSGRGLVSAFRYGLFAVGKSRIVIDVTRPVEVNTSIILPSRKGGSSSLVIDFIETDRGSFLKKVAEGARDRAAMRKARKKKIAALPRKKRAPPVISAAPARGKPVIIVDPGHGGIDPGAIGPGGTKEKEIVFEFSKLLKKKLEATGRYKVFLTREVDSYISLRERVRYARTHNGSLFISIHADSLGGKRGASVRGATVHTLSEKSSDAEAEALAAKENRSDIIAGVDLGHESNEVTDILIDLAQRETKNLSISFAKTLVRDLNSSIRLNKNPHRYAGFRVLRSPDVPSVLVELGYLSNRDDERLLNSRSWREKATGSVVKAVSRYFKTKLARAPF